MAVFVLYSLVSLVLLLLGTDIDVPLQYSDTNTATHIKIIRLFAQSSAG